MLNVFLHFLNSFLLCLFFLAGLIPQLLQKSPFLPVSTPSGLPGTRVGLTTSYTPWT